MVHNSTVADACPKFSPAMSAAAVSFDSWLIGKLTELNIDEGVFGSYIRGILEGDETHDEKTEALEGILDGITEDEIGKHVSEILQAWSKLGLVKHEEADDVQKEDVDVRLARMLESQNLATTTHKNSHTAEERRIKEAILAQYSQMSDQEESEDENNEDPGGGGATGAGDSGLAKNTNVSDIVRAQKEQRERAKLDSQRKKEKDKEDREKQKLAKEEKKEKRKTHKGERRR